MLLLYYKRTPSMSVAMHTDYLVFQAIESSGASA